MAARKVTYDELEALCVKFIYSCPNKNSRRRVRKRMLVVVQKLFNVRPRTKFKVFKSPEIYPPAIGRDQCIVNIYFWPMSGSMYATYTFSISTGWHWK
jgi:hypothetical protein